MNIKLHELIALYYELNGIASPQEGGGTKIVLNGVLSQKMPLKVKVYLQRLNKVVSDEVELFESARKELLAKYGEEGDGVISIKPENQEGFRKELEDLLNSEKNIDTDASVDDLASIETNEYYPVFFKLVDK